MNFQTEVFNNSSGNQFFVSTEEVEFCNIRTWQTVVYKKSLNPLVRWFRPALFVGGVETSRARTQHDRVTTIIQALCPTNWENAKGAYMAELIKLEIGDD